MGAHIFSWIGIFKILTLKVVPIFHGKGITKFILQLNNANQNSPTSIVLFSMSWQPMQIILIFILTDESWYLV